MRYSHAPHFRIEGSPQEKPHIQMYWPSPFWNKLAQPGQFPLPASLQQLLTALRASAAGLSPAASPQAEITGCQGHLLGVQLAAEHGSPWVKRSGWVIASGEPTGRDAQQPGAATGRDAQQPGAAPGRSSLQASSPAMACRRPVSTLSLTTAVRPDAHPWHPRLCVAARP